MSEQVLHLDLVALAPDVDATARQALIAAAGELAALPSVLCVGVIEAEAAGGDFDLAFFFVLDGFAALEPFGTHAAYVAFLQVKLAPLLRGLAGADVRLEADFPSRVAPYAACLALAAPPQTYDWEVSAALKAWSAAADVAGTATGLAIGERGRFRGLSIAFDDAPLTPPAFEQRPFGPSLICGRARGLP